MLNFKEKFAHFEGEKGEGSGKAKPERTEADEIVDTVVNQQLFLAAVRSNMTFGELGQASQRVEEKRPQKSTDEE